MSRVTVSSKGQVVIPARVRRELGLKTGQLLRLSTAKGKAIVLTVLGDLPSDDVDAVRDRWRAWVEETGRDPVEELHARRGRERVFAAATALELGARLYTTDAELVRQLKHARMAVTHL